MADQPALNEAQRRTLDALRKPAGGLPDFGGIGIELEADLEAAVAPLVARWQALHGDRDLRVTKWDVSGVGQCEKRRVYEQAEKFTWTVAKARGSVVGEMIQLWFFGPQLTPGELWSRATGSLMDRDSSLGGWVRTLATGEWVELRKECESALVGFTEVFPPVGATFRPAVEAKQAWSHEGLMCEGRVDVQLGADQGTRAGTVNVELKSGRLRVEQMVELRHYALLRALRTGVPPRASVLFSVAEGRFLKEDVTEPALWQAAARLIDAVQQKVELAEGREPTVVPGPLCGWCPLQQSCPQGRAFDRDAA